MPLLAHETNALVQNAVVTEETGTITVNGFAKPVRTYRVIGLRDDSAEGGRVIRQEQDGLLFVLDPRRLTGERRVEALRVLEATVARLKE